LTKNHALTWLSSTLKDVDFTDVLVEGDCYRARSLSLFVSQVYTATATQGRPLSRAELLKVWYANQRTLFLSLTEQIRNRRTVLSVGLCSPFLVS
jgi:hypothetical protein